MTKLNKREKSSTFAGLQDDEEIDTEFSHRTHASNDVIIGEKVSGDSNRSDRVHEKLSPIAKEREASSKKIGGSRGKEPYKMNIDSIIEEENRQKALYERTSMIPKVQEIPSKAKICPYMQGVLSAVRDAEAKLDFKPSPEASGMFLASEEAGAERDRPHVDNMGFVVNQRAANTKTNVESGSSEERDFKISRCLSLYLIIIRKKIQKSLVIALLISNLIILYHTNIEIAGVADGNDLMIEPEVAAEATKIEKNDDTSEQVQIGENK